MSELHKYSCKLKVLGILLCLLSACTSPGDFIARQAEGYGFKRIELAGQGFTHIAFVKGDDLVDPILHVYLEGDGLPWATPTRISADPTPRHPLMLELMALDAKPSLYLGRPCYNGRSQRPGCTADLWTGRRYSAEVVDSMARALEQFMRDRGDRRLVFIGYSGGGTLAVLLAHRYGNTRAVVTLAGNLDIEQWSNYHGYTPLSGSLNPATLPSGSEAWPEIHYIGDQDANVLARFIMPRVTLRSGIEVDVIHDFDHICCWRELWPLVLKRLRVLER